MRRALLLLLTGTLGGCGLEETGLQAMTTEDAGARESSVDCGPNDAGREASRDAVVTTDGSRLDGPASKDVVEPETEAAADSGLGSAGDALQFDGGQFVSGGSLPLPTDFTIEAWINPTRVPGEVYIVAEDEEDQGTDQFRFGLTSTGKLFFLMSDSSGSTHGLYGSGGYVLGSSAAIATGTWTEVAVTKDGADFELLINGTRSILVTADSAFSAGSNVDFRIGGRVASDGSGLNGGFQGTIDEVRFWSTPQSDAAVASNMTHEIGISDPRFSQLFAYYRFDEGSGTMAGDTTTHYPGTLSGAPLPAWVVSGAF